MRNEPVRTAWDSADMKQSLDSLTDEVDSRLSESHANLMSMAGAGHMFGDVARLRDAMVKRADSQAALARAWTDVERARSAATFAMGELLRALPRDARGPLLQLIPVAMPSTSTEEWKSGDSIINTSQKLRGAAHEADNKLVIFKGAVQRYSAYRIIAERKIRWALQVETGLDDEEIARREQLQAQAELNAASERQAEVVTFTIGDEAQS